MLAKFIDKHTIEKFYGIYICDEEVTLENGETVIEKIVFTNNEAETKAKESGEWLELIEEETPQFNEETEYLDYEYIQEGNKIIKHYEVLQIPELEEGQELI